ncbi:DUF896 domain-containing protein [Loigolactobacillus zhaoyuanensis]|uniref:UPF0291 protein ACEN34_01525 n=1 Tax=Loigolactobacillus zhaoyuanensis TaxID=2486017 RepID=A0ABW8UDY1_9LACO|nr:DUF896 domain-containing protein [Loigolactobacillus zhaoyuanensis]
MENKYLKRINELARIAKTDGLNADEQAEQKELRQAYVKEFRAGLRQQIEQTQIFNKKGDETTPKKVQELQRKNGWRKD